jgi:hypothetical protein
MARRLTASRDDLKRFSSKEQVHVNFRKGTSGIQLCAMAPMIIYFLLWRSKADMTIMLAIVLRNMLKSLS